MQKSITKRTLESTPAGSKDLFIWDTEVRGFGCKITPAGKRVFVFQYQAPGLHRVRKRYTIGEFGPNTVDQARKSARALKTQVDAGIDPALEKAEHRRAKREDTVEALFKTYLDDIKSRLKPRTLELYNCLAKRYVLPELGKKPVASVTKDEIRQLHTRIAQTTPVTANRVVRLIRAFYSYLIDNDRFDKANPARKADRYRETARERFLSTEELVRLGEALRIAETIGLAPGPEHAKPPSSKRKRNTGMFTSELRPANPVAVSVIRFLMITGWREQEAMTLQWAAVDLTTGIATLEDSKSGKSVRNIGNAGVALLASLPRVAGSPYVFPGRDPMKPLRETQRLWYAARYAAGLHDVRLHDLRHSVASIAASHGYSLFLIGKLLGHKSARSTERYAHLADDARKTMADRVSETINGALTAGDARAQMPFRSVS